jgi:hypothetical protein
MNPSEAWALLTIRSKNFEMQSKGHGSTSSADVAALLAGLDREPFLMGLAAECADIGALQQVELVLWARANTISDREDWDAPRGYFTVRRMVGVALYEAMEDHRCYGCNGTGSMAFQLRDHPGMMMAPTFEAISPTAGKVRCVCCQGSGVIRLSGRKRAELAGINKDTWTRLWGRRYESIFNIARDWRQSAKNHLASRVRDENDEVDKPLSDGIAETVSVENKKPIQNKGSCAVVKIRATKPSRIAAPIANVDPVELDFGAFQRAILRLSR